MIRMNPIKWVIFDMDDTLCHFTRGFFQWMIEDQHPWLVDKIKYEYSDYHLLSPFKGQIMKDDDLNFWLQKFEESGKMNVYLKPTDLFPYYQKLLGSEYHLLIITARGWMNAPFAITSGWLKDHLGLASNVNLMVVPLGQDKAESFINSQLYFPGDEVVAVFDDVENHLKGFQTHFPYSVRVAPLRPWNAGAPAGKEEIIFRHFDFGQ